MFNTHSAVALLLALSTGALAQAEMQHDESESEPTAIGIVSTVKNN